MLTSGKVGPSSKAKKLRAPEEGKAAGPCSSPLPSVQNGVGKEVRNPAVAGAQGRRPLN